MSNSPWGDYAAPPVPPSSVPSAPAGLSLSVIGTGYLGATHAICMALLGHRVVGIDVDENKIRSLA
ncbi:hypothetical protein ACFQ50_24465, partial [Arthrobacter sp. NPDC056493]